jgi:thiol-disulfide isomerase/thioredoxin
VKAAQLAQVAFIALASFLVYAFVATAKDGETRRSCTALCSLLPNYSAQNRLAPNFELKTLTGETRRLSDYRGEVVVLNFWTKTCGPCLEEMPSLAKFAHTLKQSGGMRLVTITTDDSAEDARATLQSLLGSEPPFEVLVDPDAKVVGDLFGTTLYPETWFIDPDGIIRARIDGARDWSKPLALEFAESLRGPMQCDVEFAAGEPRGPLAGLCEEIAPGG